MIAGTDFGHYCIESISKSSILLWGIVGSGASLVNFCLSEVLVVYELWNGKHQHLIASTISDGVGKD